MPAPQKEFTPLNALYTLSVICLTDWNDLALAMIWNLTLPDSPQPSGGCGVSVFKLFSFGVKVELPALPLMEADGLQRCCFPLARTVEWALLTCTPFLKPHLHGSWTVDCFHVGEFMWWKCEINPGKLHSSWKLHQPGLCTELPNLACSLSLAALVPQHHSDKLHRKPT